MRLFLVRHGQTDWNVMNRAQGSVDRPLDETGIAQSQAVARALATIPIDRVLTSDLQRARNTAQAIADATGAKLLIEPQMSERSFGTMEGDSYEDLRDFFNRESGGDAAMRNRVRPPGGESFFDLWQRLSNVLPVIQNGPESQVLVSHGGTCALLCAMILGETLEDTVKYRFSNAGITEFDGGRIVRFDDVSHLEGLPLLVKRGDVAAR
ncbi:histidine phosphatase family protein [bacterium]|nr:MAG: histidine phosphatase family protein [bacterium]